MSDEVIADLAPYGGGVRAVVLSAHVLQTHGLLPGSFILRDAGQEAAPRDEVLNPDDEEHGTQASVRGLRKLGYDARLEP
jgi:hypothetical protein